MPETFELTHCIGTCYVTFLVPETSNDPCPVLFLPTFHSVLRRLQGAGAAS